MVSTNKYKDTMIIIMVMIVLNEKKLEKIIEYKCIQAVTTITKHWDYKGTKKDERKKQTHTMVLGWGKRRVNQRVKRFWF